MKCPGLLSVERRWGGEPAPVFLCRLRCCQLLLGLVYIPLPALCLFQGLLILLFMCVVKTHITDNLPSQPLLSAQCSSVNYMYIVVRQSLELFFFSCQSDTLVVFTCSVVSDSSWPHGLQQSRLPCQIHAHWVGDAIQPSHLVSPFSCP